MQVFKRRFQLSSAVWKDMFRYSWLEKQLQHIAQQLSFHELQAAPAEDEDLTDASIEQYLSTNFRTSQLFLDFYTRQGLINAFERYGVFNRLRNRGFDPVLSLQKLDPSQHRLRVNDAADGALLGELVCQFVYLKSWKAHDEAASTGILKLIAIRWLLLQNPRLEFADERPRLPGQEHPGLGIGREVMILLKLMAQRLEREGLLAFPSYYHNGLMYDWSFRFLSPEREGELRALRRDLKQLSLAESSWAVDKGLVFDPLTGTPFQWHSAPMIWPISKNLRDYFQAGEYATEVERITAKQQFSVDTEPVNALMRRVRNGEMV